MVVRVRGRQRLPSASLFEISHSRSQPKKEKLWTLAFSKDDSVLKTIDDSPQRLTRFTVFGGSKAKGIFWKRPNLFLEEQWMADCHNQGWDLNPPGPTFRGRVFILHENCVNI